MPFTSCLTITVALTAVENKISDDYNTKINEIKKSY